MKGEVAGHPALSRLIAPEGWLVLAPAAARPDMQGRGIGSAPVREAAAGASDQTVVVSGGPSFYGRRGFSAVRASRLNSGYPVAIF